MRTTFLFFFLFLSATLFAENSKLELSSLKSSCTLRKEWFGAVQVLTYGVWLDCSGVRFLVTGPNNLTDHVKISTPEKALEYVRFFSSFDSYNSFDMNSMIEILPADSQSPRFNEIDAKVFQKKFTSPSVRRVVNTSEQNSQNCGQEFVVSRTVLLADENIYEIKENVCENGFYVIASKKLLFENAENLGILYPHW